MSEINYLFIGINHIELKMISNQVPYSHPRKHDDGTWGNKTGERECKKTITHTWVGG